MDINLSQAINRALDTRPKDAPRNYVGASSIGHDCARAIWYQAHGAEEGHINHRVKRIFDNGKVLESMLLDYIELTTTRVIRPNAENNWLHCSDKELPYFAGHMDALLFNADGPVIVLDIKTCNHLSFDKFVNNGLRHWQPKYYAQLQAYMGMTGHKYACLLAYDKDDSRLHDETIAFDEMEYAALKEKARVIYTQEIEPERINKSPLYFVCRNCSYKETCHDRRSAS